MNTALLIIYLFVSCVTEYSYDVAKVVEVSGRVDAIKKVSSEKYLGHQPGGCINYFQKAELVTIYPDGKLTREKLESDVFKDMFYINEEVAS